MNFHAEGGWGLRLCEAPLAQIPNLFFGPP